MELKCRVCGKPQKDDCRFYVGTMLCNRHYLQMRNHGKFLDDELIINPERDIWTQDEVDLLTQEYKLGTKIQDIAKKLNRTYSSVQRKSAALELGKKYPRKNNTRYYKPIYQEYDWFYDEYITQGKSLAQIAEDCGATLRVIQKWADEKHNLNETTYRKVKKLTLIQREIIAIGRIGDGHIDRRETQPMYIESHAETEKDYLFWKYSILKDLCKKEPKYYPPKISTFSSGKQHFCKAAYRLNTRIIDELAEIRSLSNEDIISNMTELQFSCLMLDDGSNSRYWSLCVAEWTDSEIELFSSICIDKFKVKFNRGKDKRYINFDAISSERITEIILKNIPNNLDIIKKKITENKKLKPFQHSFYVLTKQKKIGLATYCKQQKLNYKTAKEIVENQKLDFPEIPESDLLKLYRGGLLDGEI